MQPSESVWKRVLPWALVALVVVFAPLVFNSSASVYFLSTMGTLILFCLSYNMLLGQGGMLSFGHAVYSGLGAHFAVHAMNMAADGSGLYVPVYLIPLVGGIAGMCFGALFGLIMTKKAGMTFAMITLGIGELVFALSHMFPRFFGGEGGLSTNRSYGEPLLGLSFGPQIQVYYLIAFWLALSTLVMYAFTQTPLGRIANAVRDNPERAEFIGYDTRRVRYIVLVAATFFAGVSGGLSAINFEVISAESLSAQRSADALILTFIGGTASFAGPIVGAVVGGFLMHKLSDFTGAWQFYIGAFFVLFVMFAPAGLTGVLSANWRVIRHGRFGRVAREWSTVVFAATLIALGSVVLVELAYIHAFGTSKAAAARLLDGLGDNGMAIGTGVGVLLIAIGGVWLRARKAAFVRAWDAVNADIDAQALGGGKTP
ncbi:branched-chain amino acid ABC transporter permease [Hydrogenophaga sp.]|uniref:branched-chain amino acid ABC transporter permease n=1 Tax=Hydrogenophaga sp. TaxID=1904254 RepID=UPI00261A5DFD|nr:branched-chain amino acid ABC transporter permease [Hydrogenophaga sp.]MCW5654376.1 branched-chain amino acid ABC transporter permease [Hydrogenophaga sp.]